MPDDEYYTWLAEITGNYSSVVILYPESLHRLSIEKGEAPEKIVSWVYNANTARQHRDIAFYGVLPDFRRVKQPYKNQNDKRIKALMAQGKGARLYDWWQINQVKNVSAEKTVHPCQMPLEVMTRIIGILPDNIGVIDPFCGSGTTGVACKQLGIPFEGYDINEDYCEIARSRIQMVDEMEVKE
jgi:site-specific DNA-methyltransferase (adenine-specific)